MTRTTIGDLEHQAPIATLHLKGQAYPVAARARRALVSLWHGFTAELVETP